jgi:hypothetical protein
MPTRNLEEALPLASGPLSRLALEYSFCMRDLVAKAKAAEFTSADWAPLAAFVATDTFDRIGNFRERVDWSQYVDLLTMWGKATEWDFTVRRVTEGDGYAILELEEYARYPDRSETYTSVSTYDFNAERKLRHLEIYLARAEALAAAQIHSWDWEDVKADIV